VKSTVAVGVLGPLQVSVAGRPVSVTSARLRTLLAVLATSAPTPVSIDRLADAIWADDLPDDARRSVQVYVTRLRSALGADVIRTYPDGYQLASDQVDAVRFVRLLDAAAAAPDPGVERARLAEALALWRGMPFEGVRSAWLVETELPQLTERYLAALERHIDLDLADGRHGELAARLNELTAQYAVRERFWAQLMLALYRSGRQADALEAYQRLYRLLADELGVEPSRPVQDLHRRILAADAALDAPAGRRRIDLPVPRQLPTGIRDFTGRAAALDQLDALLPATGAAATAVTISVIAGGAGVGKTALALHWAHRVQDRFPDGQLYVNLRGFDPSGQAMRPAEAIRDFLEALGMPPQRIPTGIEAQVGLYRSLLAGKRALVLLDNAGDAEQVRPLLPGAPGCLVVVTSRNQLPGLVVAQGADPVLLDVLSAREARQLLTRRLGADRIAAEPGAAEAIIASCARLPLALSIVAARAAAHPRFPLAALAGELQDSRVRLDALSGADGATDPRAVFSWSYRALDTAAARLFRLLGLHPNLDIATPAAASAAGVRPPEIRPLLAELGNAHLVTERTPGRFSLHDLLHAYAAELVLLRDTAADRRAALHRILDHYLGTAVAAARLLNPYRDHPVVPALPRPGVTLEDFTDLRQASAWVATERATLLTAVDLAAGNGFDTHAWQLTWALAGFLARAGHWHEWAATQRVALAAVERLGDRVEQARAHRGLARAYRQLGRFEDAHTHLRHALRLYAELGDLVGEGHTHNSLGQMYESQDRPAEALGHARQALELLQRTEDRSGEALALNAVGWCHARLGNHQQALAHCRRALDLQQDLGDQVGAASSWDSLGYVHSHLGDHRQAVACYQRSRELRHDHGDRYGEARTLARLGGTYRAAGDDDEARAAWRHAVAILDDLDHPDADDVRSRLAELPDARRAARRPTPAR
jgi:DNA-binding SARP family transcriptional activator